MLTKTPAELVEWEKRYREESLSPANIAKLAAKLRKLLTLDKKPG